MQQFQERMDVIGNNIANVNTTAFKSARTDFADAFSQTLNSSNSGTADARSTPMQVGTGVTTATIRNNYGWGALSGTGISTDLAVNGDGFFVVRDTASNEQLATRAGEFQRDSGGYLVTGDGHRVQGFSNSGLSTRGDILIDAGDRPAGASATAAFEGFSIDKDGKVSVKLTDGTVYTRGQILLQNFSDPQALRKEGGNLYSGLAGAGPLGGADAPASGAPGSSGLGTIQSGYLELSNVDLANEFAGLITTQRAFQASARIITTSDEFMQELVNLKR